MESKLEVEQQLRKKLSVENARLRDDTQVSYNNKNANAERLATIHGFIESIWILTIG